MSITGHICLELCSGLCFYLAIFRLLSYQIFSHFPWHKIRRPVTTVSESKLVIGRFLGKASKRNGACGSCLELGGMVAMLDSAAMKAVA